MFTDFRRERIVRKTLRGLSRQRVVIILDPGGLLVVEKGPDTRNADARAALQTCLLRGWIAVHEHAVPTGRLGPNMEIPNPATLRDEPVYRLTDTGWAVIYRVQLMSIAAVLLAAASLIVSLAKHG